MGSYYVQLRKTSPFGLTFAPSHQPSAVSVSAVDPTSDAAHSRQFPVGTTIFTINGYTLTTPESAYAALAATRDDDLIGFDLQYPPSSRCPSGAGSTRFLTKTRLKEKIGLRVSTLQRHGRSILYIDQVYSGLLAASDGGFKLYQPILTVNDRVFTTPADFIRHLQRHPAGQAIRFELGAPLSDLRSSPSENALP